MVEPEGRGDAKRPDAPQRRSEDTPRGLEVIPLSRAGEGPAISPQMTAVFGGLFGLATMASIVALLIQVFPVENQRAVVARAAITANGSAAPAVAKPRKVPKRQRKLVAGPWRVSTLKDGHLVKRGTMKRRSFITALKESGVPVAQVYRILKSLEEVKKFDRTGKRDKFVVAMKRGTKKVVGFEYEVDATEIYQAREGKDGLLKGTKLDMKVGQEEFTTAIYIGKDFVKSYRDAGLEKGLTGVINKAFNGQTSTEAFEEGGTLKLVLVETTALGAFVRYERLKALEYGPPDPSKKPLRAYWFESGGVRGYVDEKGRRPSHRGWRTPVPGAPITSHFNLTRMHPVLKRVMPHNGTDYGASSGTPIYAAFRGTISLMGMHGASGNLTIIDHPGGIQTGYAHQSRFAKGLKRGDKVGTRQLIGYIGTTGRSTGPHLHFSAKKNGKFFNALELKMDALQLLPVRARGEFLEQKRALDAVLEKIPLPEPPEPEPEPEPVAANQDDEPARSPDDAPPDDEPAAKGKDQPASMDSGDDDDLMGEDLSGDIE